MADGDPPDPDRPAQSSWEAILLAGMNRALRLSFGPRHKAEGRDATGRPTSAAAPPRTVLRPTVPRPVAPQGGAPRPTAEPPRQAGTAERRPAGPPPIQPAGRPAIIRPGPARRPAHERGVGAWFRRKRSERTWRAEGTILAVVAVMAMVQLTASADRVPNDGTRQPGLAPPSDTLATDSAGRPPAAPPSPVEGVGVGLDGDGSIVLDSGVRVFMFGVALPDASDPPVMTQTMMAKLEDAIRGQRFAVEFDPSLTADMQRGDDTQYGYVWFIDEAGYRRGMLNAIVLSLGIGRPTTTLSYRYRGQFVEAAELAKRRRIGVWGTP